MYAFCVMLPGSIGRTLCNARDRVEGDTPLPRHEGISIGIGSAFDCMLVSIQEQVEVGYSHMSKYMMKGPLTVVFWFLDSGF